MDKLRLGVVGAGYISRSYHCPSLVKLKRQFPSLELAAICDLDRGKAEAAARDFGFRRACGSVEELLAGGSLDAALVLVNFEAMKATALQLMATGMPLLLEKPPGADSHELEELIAAAERRQVTCMVAFNRRYMPLVRRMKELAESSGAPLHLLTARMARAGRTESFFAYGTGLHSIDLMCYLGGKVREVRVEKLELPGNQAPGFLADFFFAGGLRGQLSILPECGVELERYALQGHELSIFLEAPLEWTIDYPGRLLYFQGRGKHFVQDNRVYPETMRDPLEYTGFLGEVRHFLECLTSGATPQPGLRESLQSVRIAEAIQAGRDITL